VARTGDDAQSVLRGRLRHRTLRAMRRVGRSTTERLLATLLFTDIVGSTELAARVGDRAWKQTLARHNSIVRRELKRFGGRELDTAGDGFFALFDRPAQAIECATAVVNALAAVEIMIRAAIHTGEVEVIGDKVSGIAVHAAARVLSTAGPGDIVVTGMVHDLVAGSDIRFADRGLTELRGVPGEWRLYAVEQTVQGPVPPPAEPIEPAGIRQSRTRLVIGIAAATALLVAGAVLWSLFVGNAPPPLEASANTVVKVGPASAAVLALAEISDPTEMVVDSGALWVLSSSGRNLIRVDLATFASAPIGLPATPTGLTAAGGAIWITTGFGATAGDAGVVQVGIGSRRIEGTIALGAGVDGIAAGDGALWVTNRLRNTLTRINLTTRTVTGELEVGEQPEAVAFGEGAVWVANTADRTVWRVDPRSMLRTAEISLIDVPYDLATGFGRIWVTSALGNSVVVIDVASNSLQRTLDVQGTPRGVSVGTDSVWLADAAGNALRLDPDDPTQMQTIPLAGAPHDVAAEGDGAWVSIRE